jgi:hypothetical protein
METFQQLFALNSDMSHYLPEASGEELHNTTQVEAMLLVCLHDTTQVADSCQL